MSNSNNRQFLSNPVRFADRHMLSISGGLRSVDQPQNGLDARIPEKENYFSVGKELRVLSCNLRPSQQTNDAQNTVTVEIRDDAQPRDFPVFFLPWAADRVVKVKLSDPRPNPTDEVRIFFTAAVDGCSVFVEGDPANPTVYHANATSYNPNNLVPAVANELILLRRQKAALMQARVRAIRQNKMTAAPGTTGNMRVVEHRDYAPGAVDPLSNVERERIIGLTAREAGADAASIGQGTAARRSGEQESIAPTVNFKGTVFGVKNRRATWEFYYQLRATVQIWLPNDGADDLTKRNNWTAQMKNIPVSTNKFWPDGSGTAVARPTTVVAWPPG